MNARVYLYGDEIKTIWCKCGRSESVISSSCAQRQGTAESKLQNNVIRAKSRVTELALCNPWEYFVTLTVADKSENGTEHDRTNLDDYVKSLGQWISHFNRKYNASLKYILIPEEHKAGGWHMHGLLHDIPDAALVKNEHGYLDLPFYRARFGWVSLSAIRDKKRCARYITKYVTKTFLDVGSRSGDVGKHLFYASHGLKGRVLLGERDIPIPDDAYVNDYCYIKWYKLNEPIVDRWGELVVNIPMPTINT